MWSPERVTTAGSASDTADIVYCWLSHVRVSPSLNSAVFAFSPPGPYMTGAPVLSSVSSRLAATYVVFAATYLIMFPSATPETSTSFSSPSGLSEMSASGLGKATQPSNAFPVAMSTLSNRASGS